MFVRKSKYRKLEKKCKGLEEVRDRLIEECRSLDKEKDSLKKALEHDRDTIFTYDDAIEICNMRDNYFKDRLNFARGLADTNYVKELMYQQWECDTIMGLIFEQIDKKRDKK